MSPCEICPSFTKEQQTKITHRKRYIKRGDKKTDKNDEDADLLGDNSIESFGGSHAELEVAAESLFTSPPRPQPLSFEALSQRTPARTVPPTPGTALNRKFNPTSGSPWDLDLIYRLIKRWVPFRLTS